MYASLYLDRVRASVSTSSPSYAKQTRRDVLLDICGGREAGRVASDVDRVRILIDPDIVDTHCRGERKLIVLDSAEALGYAEVHDEVLRGQCTSLTRYRRGSNTGRAD